MKKQRMTNDLAIIEDVLVNYCDITDIPYDDTYKLNFDRVNDFINVSLKEHELLDLKNDLIHQYHIYLVFTNITGYASIDKIIKNINKLSNEISQLEEELKVKE